MTPSRRLLAPLVAAVLAVAGCASSAVQQVTVTVGKTSVTLPAALTCLQPKDSGQLSCVTADADKAPHLAIAPGTDVDIAVPESVSSTPWVVVFAYTDSAGKAEDGRSAVFSPGKESHYQLVPPNRAQLTRLEVQSLTAAPGRDGGVDFPAVGSWALVVTAPKTAA